MPRVSHFEIHADHPDRAIKFYRDTFEWRFERWSGGDYWLIMSGGLDEAGIDGGLMKRRGPAPTEGQAVNGYVCTIMVPNLDAYHQKVMGGGGSNAVPRMPVPGVGWLAYYKDPEGNLFGMMQHDPSAK